MSDVENVDSLDRVRQPRNVPERETERPDRSEDAERARDAERVRRRRAEEAQREEEERAERDQEEEYRGRNVNTFA